MDLIHLVAELYGCGPALADEAALVGILERGAKRVGAQVVESARARYAPHGLTVAIFLAESHATLTTWPEHELALLDVLLCNDRMDPDAFLDAAVAELRPARGVRRQRVVRRIAPAPDPASRGAG
jgi:S-adenosylmethionine decarboxylase